METREYWVWKDATCFVCSGGTGKPRLHASMRYPDPERSTPCMTIPRLVKAKTRRKALQTAFGRTR